jgi:hypothetical protein
MPLELSDLKVKRRSVAVQYDDEIINIEYCPGMVTPEYQSAMLALAKCDTNEDQVAAWEQILAVMVSWDITNDGEPLPITRETLGIMPTDLLIAIMQAITADANPNARSAGTSGAGLRRMGR